MLQSGGGTEALKIARGVASEAPGAPDAQHALALCCAAQGDQDGAEQAFARALALAPAHPLVLRNYAKFLTDLGLVALRDGRTGKAVETLERAIGLRADSSRAWHALGSARRAGGDLEGAETALRRAVELAPTSGPAWVNLGVVLRLLGRPAEALPCLAQARKAGYSGPELEDADAGARVDVGRFEEALDRARALVRAHPEYVPGQIMLVHLLWEHGGAIAPGEDPLALIRTAVRDQPGHRPLHMAYIALLLEIQRPEDALDHIRALRKGGSDPLLIALEAGALEMLDRHDHAGVLFEQAHRALGSSDAWFLNAYARHLLKSGKWDAAALRATEATEIDPVNQEAWAYLGTAWRLLGDPREEWLCDYERLISLVEVEPPPGFGGMDEFLVALVAALEPLHKARREPIHQSLRGGSQTPGKLFGRPDPVINAARHALLQAIEHRLAALPTDSGHPFLQRKARSVRFSGSWSVRLWSAGRHVNHIHPEGWMSSAFYVSLPPSVRDQSDAEETAGFIQFGQPSVELGLNLPPRRVIRPQVGYLALFPSYMWHGTVPFEDDAPRITVAFDMTPRE
jgi:Flp pilus assembly protein TadD